MRGPRSGVIEIAGSGQGSPKPSRIQPGVETGDTLMFLKSTLLALGASLAVVALQPALAHDRDRDSDSRRDVSEIRRDRQAVAADEARIAHERAELNAARARQQQDFRSGHFFRGIGDGRQVREEARELNAAERKLQADRAKLQSDRRDLHEDHERRNRS